MGRSTFGTLLRFGRGIRMAVAVTMFAGLAACGGVESDKPDGDFVPPVVEWQLVLEDNFDGDALDVALWNVDEGDGCPDRCGWGNNELQTYSADNIEVSGGTLKLLGQVEADGSYTSARINTQGKFDFQYGRIEIGARIPSGQGIWPAIWMLHSPAGAFNPEYPDVGIYGPWPVSGEIDIMEAFNYGVGGNQSTQSTAHYGLPTPPYNGTSSTTELAANADLNFHEYALEWERGRLRFFIDGQQFQTQIVDEYYAYYPANDDGLYNPYGPYTLGLEDAPFDQLFHLILNFAIGGNPVGAPDATTIFPQSMEVDYVRVYECANSNPESRRGCGTADPSIEPLEDHDGGPLENLVTAKPYIELVDLFLDGPETITLTVGQESGSNMLGVNGFTGDGATVVNDPAAADPDDPANTVWHVSVSGGVANVYLESEDLTEDPLLDTGFDFSGGGLGGDPVGEIVFDMFVNSIDAGTNLFVKLDSGFPNLGEVVIPTAEIAVGEWKTYSIKFDDLLANPGFVDCCGGQGVDLENVLNPFVFEVQNGAADVLLDNIRVTNACYVVGACGAGPRTKGIPDLLVFDDAVNLPVWDRGIVASDSGTGFSDYTDGTNPANKVNWQVITDVDAERGEVVDVTFNNSSAFGVWFFGSSGAVDTNAYAAGAVQFDLIVDDYGNSDGMTFKIDCFFPCTSGDKNLGKVADGVWETITYPVASLTATGLDLDNVNVGLVLFPTTQSGTIRFRVDNVRWVADSDAIPLEQIDLPVDFDNLLVDYSLIDFEGASTSIIEDPTDSTNNVASTVKGEGAATFAGTVIGTDAGFANPIPFAAGATTMSVRVNSPAADVSVMMKVETADGAVFAEVIANTTVANEWETIVFDFSLVGIDVDQVYTKAIIFFDFGQTGVGDTYLWDDVEFGEGATLAQINLPVTFEDPTVDYSLSDFEGASTVVGADPANPNNTVAATTKTAGSPFFAGTIVGKDFGGFASPIPFTATDTTMTVKVLSPAAGINVRMKVENAADGNIFAEVDAATTVANEWETMRFDFSAAPGFDPNFEYSKVVIFFDFVVDKPADGSIYYWDDMALGDLIQPIDLPITFDDPFVDYTVSDFEGAATVLEADPTGADNTVAATTKTAGSPFFAGTVIGRDFGGFASPIPFTATETVMSVRVYSPAAGIPVRLKVENSADGAIFAEMDVVTTTANAWEPLNFDFSTVGIDTTQEFDKAVIFFDFVVDKPADGSKYYWDDLQFGARLRQIDLPVTFEEPFVDYGLSDFEGASTVLANDPTAAPNTVAATTKTAGSPFFAGTVIGRDFGGFASPIPFTATETTVSVMVYSPAAGIPVRLKVENSANGNIFAEMDAATGAANTWQVLNFDFSTVNIDTSQVFDKAVIFFDFVVDKPADGSTYYWDDLQFGVDP